MSPIPYTVIGGFLGSGKTTLLNHLLTVTRGERLAVLVNDFGRVDLAVDLIAEHDGDTITLTNGCICCAVDDDLVGALVRLAASERPPDRVVVEASGIADPGGVAQYGTRPGYRLDGVLTVVDAETIRARFDDRRLGPQVRRQLERADLLVLNKVDLVDAAVADDVRSWLRTEIPGVAIVSADHGRVDPTIVFGASSVVGAAAPGDPIAHDVEVREWIVTECLDAERLDRFLDSLPPDVLRVKGIVALCEPADTSAVVHVVGRRRRVTRTGGAASGPAHGRLVLLAVAGVLDGVDRPDWARPDDGSDDRPMA